MVDFGNNSDFLGGSALLRQARIPRSEFDPQNSKHLKSLKTFLDTGNWGPVQFYIEAPYTTVPETVLRKMANYSISKLSLIAE